MKRAQTSIYLILAVILVLIFILLLFSGSGGVNQRHTQSDPVSDYVIACLEQAGIQSILDVSDAGGNGTIPPITDIALPQAVPSVQSVEKAVADNTWQYLDACYHNFSDFTQQGTGVKMANPSGNHLLVTLTDSRVALQLHQPLTVVTKGSQHVIQDFSAGIDARVSDVISDAKKIQTTYPEGTDTFGNRFNTTYFSKDSQSYAVIEFPIKGYERPGRWWVLLK